MPQPRVTRHLTTTQVARHLGMSVGQIVSWVKRGALPPPTSVDENGTRYFDQEWLEIAREILRIKRGEPEGGEK